MNLQIKVNYIFKTLNRITHQRKYHYQITPIKLLEIHERCQTKLPRVLAIDIKFKEKKVKLLLKN